LNKEEEKLFKWNTEETWPDDCILGIAPNFVDDKVIIPWYRGKD
jgi:hypothetical protein